MNIYTQILGVKVMFSLHVSGKLPIFRSHCESYTYYC